MLTKFILLYCCLLVNSALAQINSIERQLFELPDVLFTPIKTPYGYQEAFEIRIKQAIDHQAPEKGYFYQKVYLSHRNLQSPVVMVTEGYQNYTNNIAELSELLSANQLKIEHRYFGKSSPDSIDYQYLTLEQATADLHKINQIFKKIYRGKWLSTGISKGGQTSIFYRYFYPNDVDVTVPFVAPLNLELQDHRIYNFLDTIGSKTCRKAIYKLQRRLLESRDKVLPLLKWYAKGAELDFNYLSIEEAFEYSVLEYPFSFWQWGGDCAQIPSENQPLDRALEHLMQQSTIDFFADGGMQKYAAHYYQAATQMGYYGYDISPFKGLLKALPSIQNPTAAFTPNKMMLHYDDKLSKQVFEWLKINGNQFIYINGALDTWSATAVPYSDQVDALWFNMEGQDHAGARIKNMNELQKNKLKEQLHHWLYQKKR